MNTNRAFLKLLSTVLFAVLVISFSSAMINEVSADVPDRFKGGAKTPPAGGGDFNFGGGNGSGAVGALGSNNYLIIAIVGIIIVVAVLLVVKVVIPKLREK